MEKMKIDDELKTSHILKGSELLKKIQDARLKIDRLQRLAIDASCGDEINILEEVEVMQALRIELDCITVGFVEMKALRSLNLLNSGRGGSKVNTP